MTRFRLAGAALAALALATTGLVLAPALADPDPTIAGQLQPEDPDGLTFGCPTGTVPTGARVQQTVLGYVSLAGLRCTSASGAVQVVGPAGTDLDCAAGSRVVGLVGRTGDIVDAVGIRCRATDGTLTTIDPVGSPTGRAAGPVDCPTGEMVGSLTTQMADYFGDITAYSVRADCVPVSPVRVAARDASRQYGAPDPAFGYDVTGLVGGEQLMTPPTCTTTATATSHPGTYPITCSGASAGANYATPAYGPGTLTITRAATNVTVTRGLLVINPKARLVRADDGTGIAGKTVTISSDRSVLCTATTDANGYATCPGLTVSLSLGGGPHVVFAGDEDYVPASA